MATLRRTSARRAPAGAAQNFSPCLFWRAFAATKSTSFLGARFAGTRESSASRRPSSFVRNLMIRKPTSSSTPSCSSYFAASTLAGKASSSSSRTRSQNTLPTFGRYRCQDDIRSLIGWLRAHGVVSRTPLHTLRKESAAKSTLATD